MKKSLLALALALIMCLSIFTGCGSAEGEDNTIKTEAETAPMTITLYAPTKSTTTQKEIEVVQEAFNAITQAKFNTNVVLKLIPEDEYDATIESTLKNIHTQIELEESLEQSRLEAEREALLKGETLPEETEETKAPSDESTPQSKYPAVKENQLDIFLVHSFETYYDLVMSEDVSPLEQEISESSKLIKSYTYPYLLRAAKVDGSVYGVFNNTVFGNYQYLLLNKELVDKYDYDPENMKDLSSISLFLKEVNKREPGVIPFLGDIEAPVVYWNNQESVIGAYIGAATSSAGVVDATSYVPSPTAPGNLFASPEYRQWYETYAELNQAGIFVDKTANNENSKFAATIIEGDVTLSPTFADTYGNYKTDEYGFKYITDEATGVDYYVSVYKRPIADNENVFNAGYVVSAYTEDVGRCMEILTALNTDAKLANILMYGVQDVHYTLDETTNIVHKLTNSYAMDISTIGNMYLLNQSDDMNDYWTFMSKNGWQNAKNTNLEAIINPFLGFRYDPEKPLADDLGEDQVFIDKTFDEVYSEIVNLSAKYLSDLNNFNGANNTSFNAFFQNIRTETAANQYIAALTDEMKGMYYMRSEYMRWYQPHYNVVLVTE